MSVPASKVRSLDQVLAQPHVKARGFMEAAGDLPTAPGISLKVPGSGVRSMTLPATENTPPPALGQHTEAVLSELGLASEQIDVLFRDGVVAGPRA
jgi:crotonobetainyl-CoA:carnitine CoA-transferase CaiB-like acyl-CoA transferase